MHTRSLRRVRTLLLTLALGFVFAGLALAQEAPMSVDRQPGKACAPSMSVAAAQPAAALGLTPDPQPNVLCYYGIYDEWWKDGEICRWRNSCEGSQYHGSCPNGYDYHYSETVICWCRS